MSKIAIGIARQPSGGLRHTAEQAEVQCPGQGNDSAAVRERASSHLYRLGAAAGEFKRERERLDLDELGLFRRSHRRKSSDDAGLPPGDVLNPAAFDLVEDDRIGEKERMRIVD